MNLNLIQELIRRGARFAKAEPSKPFSRNHPTIVELHLSHDEANELRRILSERETKELSERRCNSCSTGLIVKEKVPRNGYQAIRYSCTCDESDPINPSDWVPIGEPTEKTS
jgi:DNA-directed RNA polymerase subunit RPC12/RpoP